MTTNYFTYISTQLGIPIWLLVLLLVWSAVWKLIALWRSARNKHLAWFIVLAIFNTAGILPILYIFVFSKMGRKAKARRKPAKRKRKTRKRKLKKK